MSMFIELTFKKGEKFLVNTAQISHIITDNTNGEGSRVYLNYDEASLTVRESITEIARFLGVIR